MVGTQGFTSVSARWMSGSAAVRRRVMRSPAASNIAPAASTARSWRPSGWSSPMRGKRHPEQTGHKTLVTLTFPDPGQQDRIDVASGGVETWRPATTIATAGRAA